MKRSILLLCLLALGCRNEPQPLRPSAKKIDPATVGLIRGVVRFEGVPPEPAGIPMKDFPQCANPKDRDDDVLIRDGRVQNAFVYVKKGLGDYEIPAGTSEATIDQKDCLYTPRIVGLQIGQTLVVRNSDPFLHNVHALPRASTGFNIGMAKDAFALRRAFDKPEVMVTIRCDIHPWMRAYVGVLPHPYFAVTGPDGAFELKGMPPGIYVLEVWHERLGTKTASVTLGSNETKAVEIRY